MIKVLKWVDPCSKAVFALNKTTDHCFPKESGLCSILFVVNYYLNRCILSGLHRRLSSLFSDMCRVVFVTLFLAIIYKCTGQNVCTGRGSWANQECSSVLLLKVLLRMWFLSCSMSSGFCCCICCANCCPLQDKSRINWGLSSHRILLQNELEML